MGGTGDDGVLWDGIEIWYPDHPEYEHEYRRCANDLRKYGSPMPYASQEAIDEDQAEKGIHHGH
jgi:hypothetical protein